MSVQHKTQLSNIYGSVDTNGEDFCSGWYLDFVVHSPLDINRLRFLQDGVELQDFEYGLERPDVASFYKEDEGKYLHSGFILRFNPENREPIYFQYYQDEKWQNFHVKGEINSAINRRTPQLIVVDNFYTNPDQVRQYALSQEFVPSGGHKGRRTTHDFSTQDLKKRFEELLGSAITKWDYKWNGCFQFCTAEDPLVIHCDTQSYAAMVFLTPNAPPSTGTSFYRKKGSHERNHLRDTFKTGFYDFTPFELVDKVGNIYNRLVIFDARLIHAASEYFGQTKEDGRLFQIFFFDV